MKPPKPPKLQGSAEWIGNTVMFRLAYGVDPSRKRHDLRDHLGSKMSSDEKQAVEQGKRLAHELSVLARAKHATEAARPTSAPKGELVTKWHERWRAWRVMMGRVESDAGDAKIFRCYIEPVIGDLPMRTVSAGNIEKIVEALDERIVSSDPEVQLSHKTAKNAWTSLRTMFKDACSAKASSGLRVRDDNPTAAVAPPEKPKRGTGEKLLAFLYPSDYLTLVTAPAIWDASQGVAKRLSANIARAKAARRWMRIFTLAIYLGSRARELKGLRWEWLDLDHWVGRIEVQANTNRDKKRTGKEDKDPKAGSFREFDIEIEVRPLLARMYEEAKAASGGKTPTGRVFPTFPGTKDQAARLRTYLMLAGCDRPELHVRTAHRVPMRFHDLRATTATWMAMRGDNPIHIQEVLGHKTLATTERYIRRVRRLRGAAWGVPFPPVPAMVVGAGASGAKTRAANRSKLAPPVRGKVASSAHRRNVAKTALAQALPKNCPSGAQVAEMAKVNCVPKGIRSGKPGKNSGKNEPLWAHRAQNCTRSPSNAVPLLGTDPVAAALRAALDTAITEGRTGDAAALATELAARTRAVSDPKVVRLATRRR